MRKILALLALTAAGCDTWPGYLKPGWEPEDETGWWWDYGYYDYYGGYYGYDGRDSGIVDDGTLDPYGYTFSVEQCVVDGVSSVCTWSGDDLPSVFTIRLFDEEYAQNWANDGTCTITFPLSGEPGTSAPEALYDDAVDTSIAETDCVLDPDFWAGDPADLFAEYTWEVTVEEMDDDTRAMLSVYFTAEELQDIVSGRLFMDGMDLTEGFGQALYGQGYPVDGGVEVTMDTQLTAAEILDGRDVFIAQTALYYWTLY